MDTSDFYWPGVVIQCVESVLSLEMEEQKHEPLKFVSGAFNGAQLNWGTFEKEGYAIFQVFWKLDYLFLCDYVHVFKDHRNFLFVYFTAAINPQIGQHVVSKVQKWGLYLAHFQYTIELVAEDRNVMVDILTRWMKGYRGKKNLAVKYISNILAESDIVPSTTGKDFEKPDSGRIFTARIENGIRRESEAIIKQGTKFLSHRTKST